MRFAAGIGRHRATGLNACVTPKFMYLKQTLTPSSRWSEVGMGHGKVTRMEPTPVGLEL